MTPDPIVRPGKSAEGRPKPLPKARASGLSTNPKPNRPLGVSTDSLPADDFVFRPAEVEPVLVRSPLLDREETARYLKVSIEMVDKFRRESRLRGTKMGNRVLYKIDLLDEFIDLNTDPPVPSQA